MNTLKIKASDCDSNGFCKTGLIWMHENCHGCNKWKEYISKSVGKFREEQTVAKAKVEASKKAEAVMNLHDLTWPDFIFFSHLNDKNGFVKKISSLWTN